MVFVTSVYQRISPKEDFLQVENDGLCVVERIPQRPARCEAFVCVKHCCAPRALTMMGQVGGAQGR